LDYELKLLNIVGGGWII